MSMLETAQELIRSSTKRLGWDEDQIESFVELNHLHKFTIKLEDGREFPAFRAQHSNKRGPYKGGIRFHPQVNDDEVQALATLMSVKTSAIDIPLGGGKGGVICDPKNLSEADLEEISRKYVRGLVEHIGPHTDIPAPDVNTNGQIMGWMVDEYDKLTGDKTRAAFTGKTIEDGGSEGRNSATGYGGYICLEAILKKLEMADKPITVAIQGLGNVGYWFAEAASKNPNVRIVGMASSKRTIAIDHKNNKLEFDVAKMIDHKREHGDLLVEDHIEEISSLPREAVLEMDVDVLILAALEDTITSENADRVQAKIIVELANGPITMQAFRELTKKGKTIIPDVVANAGGVLVSYFEWQQNLANEHWSEKQVNQMLEEYINHATEQMWDQAQMGKLTLKEAAFDIALAQLGEIRS